MPERNFTPAQKANWWRQEIRAGRKTKTQLKQWLHKNEHRLNPEELALMVFIDSEELEPVKPKWDRWRQ